HFSRDAVPVVRGVVVIVLDDFIRYRVDCLILNWLAVFIQVGLGRAKCHAEKCSRGTLTAGGAWVRGKPATFLCDTKAIAAHSFGGVLVRKVVQNKRHSSPRAMGDRVKIT